MRPAIALLPVLFPLLSIFVWQISVALGVSPDSPRPNTHGNAGNPSNVNAKTWEYICILGNSQSSDMAHSAHSKMWLNRFPSFWYVWGNDTSAQANRHHYYNPRFTAINRYMSSATSPETAAALQTVIDRYYPQTKIKSTPSKVTWARGILLALHVARSFSPYDCQYFFTHDDDLVFSVEPSFNLTDYAQTDTLPDTLISIILKHQPAVAGFPWTVGDERYPAMKTLAEKYKFKVVAPLTSFDSGMILYHRSIVDFFIPYSPRNHGPKKFLGEWSLCAHYINLFAPLLFKNTAIRINAISYKNLINMDNLSPSNRKKAKKKKDAQGLIIVEQSRHPYEFQMNRPLKRYLNTGFLKEEDVKWGRDLAAENVHWDVRVSSLDLLFEQLKIYPWLHYEFQPLDVLAALNQFYDLNHSVFKNNPYMETYLPMYEEMMGELKSNKSQKIVDLVIHIFTSKKSNFMNLWRSLSKAFPVDITTDIYIHVEKQTLDTYLEFLEYLKTISSIHGTIHIISKDKPIGLKMTVLSSWTPSHSNEFALFLQDTQIVSSSVFKYAQAMLKTYFIDTTIKNCIGISLNAIKINPITNTKLIFKSKATTFYLQHPQKFGVIYHGEAWIKFMTWFNSSGKYIDPLIENSATNLGWNAKERWDKYMLKYMDDCNLFLVYPYLIHGSKSFATYGNMKSLYNSQFNKSVIMFGREMSLNTYFIKLNK